MANAERIDDFVPPLQLDDGHHAAILVRRALRPLDTNLTVGRLKHGPCVNGHWVLPGQPTGEAARRAPRGNCSPPDHHPAAGLGPLLSIFEGSFCSPRSRGVGDAEQLGLGDIGFEGPPHFDPAGVEGAEH
jgi:hypothetical protein